MRFQNVSYKTHNMFMLYICRYILTYIEITNILVLLLFYFAVDTPFVYLYVFVRIYSIQARMRIIRSVVYAITNSQPHLEIDGRGKILSFELVGKYRPEFGDEIPRLLQIRDLMHRRFGYSWSVC